MFEYWILEIKQLNNGEYEHYVYYAFDQDADKARLKAEAKYHEILAEACTSDTLKHSAIIVSDEAFPIINKCYKHLTETESEAVA